LNIFFTKKKRTHKLRRGQLFKKNLQGAQIGSKKGAGHHYDVRRQYIH
jgi:hypothetical protein